MRLQVVSFLLLIDAREMRKEMEPETPYVRGRLARDNPHLWRIRAFSDSRLRLCISRDKHDFFLSLQPCIFLWFTAFLFLFHFSG